MNIDMGIAYRHIRDPHTRTIATFVCNECLNKAEYDDGRETLFQHANAVAMGWRDYSTFDESYVRCPVCTGAAVSGETIRHPSALPQLPGLPAVPIPTAAKAKRKSTGRVKWKGR